MKMTYADLIIKTQDKRFPKTIYFDGMKWEWKVSDYYAEGVTDRFSKYYAKRRNIKEQLNYMDIDTEKA